MTSMIDTIHEHSSGSFPCSTPVFVPHPTDNDATSHHAKPQGLLLIWDAPNLDMGLGAILGGRPIAAYRGRWLLDRSQQLSEQLETRIEPEATVFTNVAPGGADVVRPWVEALRNVGFAVFAKPKLDDDTDVDPDMLAHIRRRHSEGVLKALSWPARMAKISATNWNSSPPRASPQPFLVSTNTPHGL